MFLSICVLSHSLLALWSHLDDFGIKNLLDIPTVCLIQALLLEYFYMAHLFWASCMSISMIAMCYSRADIRRFERYYHMFSWTVPVLFCVLSRTNMGWTGNFCWMQDPSDISMLTAYLLPALVIIFFNAVSFVLVIIKVRWHFADVDQEENASLVNNRRHQQAKKLAMRLSYYPAILAICNAGIMYQRFAQYVNPSFEAPFYMLIFIQIDYVQGLFNAIVYFSSPKVKGEYVNILFSRPRELNLQE